MTTLRQRLIEDLQVRTFSAPTPPRATDPTLPETFPYS